MNKSVRRVAELLRRGRSFWQIYDEVFHLACHKYIR